MCFFFFWVYGTVVLYNKSSQSNLGESASLSHHCATKSPMVITMGRPKFTPKTARLFPLTITTHLIHQSLAQLHSPSQTASGSNQPFCHSTLSSLTDRPTEGTWRQFYTISTYARYDAIGLLIESDALQKSIMEYSTNRSACQCSWCLGDWTDRQCTSIKVSRASFENTHFHRH